MERVFETEEIQKLIEYLQGSSNTLEEGIQAVLGSQYSSDDLTSDDFEQIYGEIFLCDDCGWWCELVDESEDNPGNCNDCYFPE